MRLRANGWPRRFSTHCRRSRRSVAHIGRRVIHGRPYEQLMTVDYEYAAILEFDTLEDLQAYLAHGTHDALAALFFEAFEVALMYDYEMTGDATALLADSGSPSDAQV